MVTTAGRGGAWHFPEKPFCGSVDKTRQKGVDTNKQNFTCGAAGGKAGADGDAAGGGALLGAFPVLLRVRAWGHILRRRQQRRQHPIHVCTEQQGLLLNEAMCPSMRYWIREAGIKPVAAPAPTSAPGRGLLV